MFQEPIFRSWNEVHSWIEKSPRDFRITFSVSPEFLQVLKDKYSFKEELFTDIYYDTPGSKLMLKGYWLKERNNKLILTISERESETLKIRKITDEDEIRKLGSFKFIFASLPTSRSIFEDYSITVDCAL